MLIVAKSPYQSEINLKNGSVHIVGPLSLIKKMNELKKKYGGNPQSWPELLILKSSDDILINEFILKVKGNFKLAYESEELCHCRMVPVEKVYNAIKQGCRSVDDVGRTTLAGTGCGSCRPDTQKLLEQFKLTSN